MNGPCPLLHGKQRNDREGAKKQNRSHLLLLLQRLPLCGTDRQTYTSSRAWREATGHRHHRREILVSGPDNGEMDIMMVERTVCVGCSGLVTVDRLSVKAPYLLKIAFLPPIPPSSPCTVIPFRKSRTDDGAAGYPARSSSAGLRHAIMRRGMREASKQLDVVSSCMSLSLGQGLRTFHLKASLFTGLEKQVWTVLRLTNEQASK